MAWTDEQKKKFCDNLMLVGELVGKELSTAGGVLFTRCMESEVDYDTAMRAVGMHLKDTDKAGSFFPKPADLLRLVKGTKEDAAQVAWAKVDHAIRHVGSYQSVAFDDAIIHRVIADMGGWPPFGQKTEEEWPFVANEFRQRYHAMKSRGIDGPYPPYLPGNSELENVGKYDEHWYRERGVAVPAPTAIGEPDRVRQVIAGGSNQPRIQIEKIGDITAGLMLPEPKQEAA